MYTILNTREKTPVDIAAFLEAVKGRDVIYIGELHQLPGVLAFQADVLRGLVDTDFRPALGLEMFNVLQQGLVDGYLSGDITLERLMEIYEEGPEGFDLRHYRHLIDIAGANGLKVRALNIPRDVAAAVARRGLHGVGLEGFKLREEEITECSSDYRKALSGVYRRHPHGEITEENFVLAQCVKDEMMAETLVGHLKEGKPFMVIAGRGHMEYGLGIPERVRLKTERAVSDVLVATAYADESYGQEAAEYIVLV